MKVEFLKKFSKDLDSITQKSIKSNLLKVIVLMESAESIDNIPNTKKLSSSMFLHKRGFLFRVSFPV